MRKDNFVSTQTMQRISVFITGSTAVNCVKKSGKISANSETRGGVSLDDALLITDHIYRFHLLICTISFIYRAPCFAVKSMIIRWNSFQSSKSDTSTYRLFSDTFFLSCRSLGVSSNLVNKMARQ